MDREQLIAEALRAVREPYTVERKAFGNPQEAGAWLTLELAQEECEYFCALWLDNRHRLLSFERLFRGTIDETSVYPREAVKSALRINAAAVIFAHNHPSGVPEPSRADEKLTARLKDALALVDVRVLDHLIVGDGDVVSLAERGLI